jgi:hypothetical protein
MADRSGPAEPSRPLDEQLLDLARATEPLVVLAGPDAARHRGEKRRARRRLAAVGAVAALALGAGCWQLLPDGGAGHDRSAPAASSSATPLPGLPETLDSALLPPSSLPTLAGRQWKIVAPALGAAKYVKRCSAVPGKQMPFDQAHRVYRADDGWIGHYDLYAFRSDGSAQKAAGLLYQEIRAKCEPSHGDSYLQDGGTTLGLLVNTVTGQDSVWLDHRGRYVAVLQVQGPRVPNGKAAGKVTTGTPWACIENSLKRLAPQWTPSPGDSPAPGASGAGGSGGTASPGAAGSATGPGDGPGIDIGGGTPAAC